MIESAEMPMPTEPDIIEPIFASEVLVNGMGEVVVLTGIMVTPFVDGARDGIERRINARLVLPASVARELAARINALDDSAQSARLRRLALVPGDRSMN